MFQLFYFASDEAHSNLTQWSNGHMRRMTKDKECRAKDKECSGNMMWMVRCTPPRGWEQIQCIRP
jgi:hypothetical protein